MDLTSYSAAAASTAVYPGAGSGSVAALAYVCLGLAGESSEVLEKELAADASGVASELGDVAWYMARLHSELGLDVAQSFSLSLARGLPSGAGSSRLVVAAGRCAELAKKALRDDAGELTQGRRDAFAGLLVDVVAAWVATAVGYRLDAGAVLDANAAKLADRRDRGVLAGSGDHR